MKKLILLGLILTVVFVSGCTQAEITCNAPYIKVGTECCLDTNNNSICDKDETMTIEVDIDIQDTLDDYDNIDTSNLVKSINVTLFLPDYDTYKYTEKAYINSIDYKIINTGEASITLAVDYKIWNNKPGFGGEIKEENRNADYIYGFDSGDSKTETLWLGYTTKYDGSYYIEITIRDRDTDEVLFNGLSPVCIIYV